MDRTDGQGFRFLTVLTELRFLDVFPITAPTTWKYRAQYRLADVPTGEWSDVVTVVVG